MKKNNNPHELEEANGSNTEKGNRSTVSRRSFLTSAAAIGAMIGSEIILGKIAPSWSGQNAFASNLKDFKIEGKHPGLYVLNDRPVNAEVPAHLLNDTITPANKLFIRNNGLPPENVDIDAWTLTIDGESSETSKTYTLSELKSKFKHHTYQLVLECGGNGRSEFNPPAKGNQWTTGAVSCAEWTGVRLRDVLKDCGIKDDAVYIGYHGADMHLSRDPKKAAISRGVPMEKALEKESLIAWAVNGENIPIMNGYPLRLVFGGWPASTSGKWLKGISIRNIVHDGKKMTGKAYRTPCNPVAPGSKVADKDMCIIENMPVKSLVTFPKSGVRHQLQDTFLTNGHAWAGDKSVKKVHISIDFGQTWKRVSLNRPANRNAWQQWKAEINFPKTGYYEVWVKATDSDGISQPMVLPGWNPKGYLNNACHRISVLVV